MSGSPESEREPGPADGPADGAGSDGVTEGRPPLLTIRGDATAEEVAALVAVLQGLAVASAAATFVTPTRPRSVWADPARAVRRTPESEPGAGLWPGRGAWRTSALPR